MSRRDILVPILIFVFGLLVVLPLVDYSVYGPIIDSSPELQRLMDEEKFTVNRMAPDILGADLDANTSVYYVSRINSSFYASVVPFVTEYRVTYVGAKGFENARIKDHSHLYRRVRHYHEMHYPEVARAE